MGYTRGWLAQLAEVLPELWTQSCEGHDEMSTPEERQEAAEYLRENSIGDVVITPYTGHADPIRFPGYKLADLIDPTCHLGPAHFGGFGCDRCFTWFPDMKKKPVYCPACGARVVDEDD